ncbi:MULTISPECIES: hypothetical protein [Paenibacillus]|uniref:Uncharacterized protein n=1 Tax=Paenibacillus albilobatus TaxID=2716884 RepID=A0A920CC61_9BACL|nr:MULTISPECIES: hypothetical protein [Paenibacillus]GIO34331.1 hypothetical protein J2TS6_54720 [Paenibacillus albilobatus]
MKFEDLKPGLPVRIADDHSSGFGGRGGIVLDAGTFQLVSGEYRKGALVDIYEARLVIEAADLEIVELPPPDPGWEEFNI